MAENDPRLTTDTTGNAENPLPVPSPAESSDQVNGPAVLIASDTTETTASQGNLATSLSVSSQGIVAPSVISTEAVQPVPRQPYFNPRGNS